MVKYGHQKNHILQDLIGFEPSIFMKGSKTGFQQLKTGLPKSSINIPTLDLMTENHDWTRWF